MTKKIIIAVAVIGAAALTFWYGLITKNDSLPKARVSINGSVFYVTVADTDMRRTQGLSGRSALAANEGMLFIFQDSGKQGFWMRGMLFPIDLIWISGGRVVGLEQNMPPDNSITPKIYESPEPIDHVLEINAGIIQRLGLKIGNQVAYPAN